MSISSDEELTAEIDRHVQMARAIKPHTLDRMALADLLRHRFPHRTVGDIEHQLIVAWQKHDLFWTSGSGRPACIKKADEKKPNESTSRVAGGASCGSGARFGVGFGASLTQTCLESDRRSAACGVGWALRRPYVGLK